MNTENLVPMVIELFITCDFCRLTRTVLIFNKGDELLPREYCLYCCSRYSDDMRRDVMSRLRGDHKKRVKVKDPNQLYFDFSSEVL